MILARSLKKEGYRERVGGEVSIQVEKKAPRSNLSLSSFRAYGHVSVRGFAHILVRVTMCRWGPLPCVCVHRRRGEGAGSSRRDVQRERAVVSLEIIINIGE